MTVYNISTVDFQPDRLRNGRSPDTEPEEAVYFIKYEVTIDQDSSLL
jgi:hypothetical protein